MLIESPAFKPMSPIPFEYTCKGEDVSPPLLISGVPKGAVSLVLIMDDPDAPMGTFDHWIAWNIPSGETKLASGYIPPMQGINGFHEARYKGPCPPPGKTHRYYFKLYALNKMLDLKAGSTKSQVEKEMQGHIVGHAELVGTFQR